MTRKVAPIMHYRAKLIPYAGESVPDALNRMDVAWPGLLRDEGIQQVGTAVGETVETRVIRHDEPGREPRPYPYEIQRAAWVVDSDAPADFVARVRHDLVTIVYETEDN